MRLLWAVRVMAKLILSRRLGVPLIEFCKTCGREQPVVWTAPDNAWGRVTGRWEGGGVLCVECFDRGAEANGTPLRWVPEPLLDVTCRTCWTNHEMMADCAPLGGLT